MITFNSPLEAFLHWEANTPEKTFLKQPINGKIISYSFAQVGEEARKIASKLLSFNLPKRSHIALLSKNCAHWHISDLAIMMAGYISIPIYPSLTSETINLILNHSESKAIIIGKLDDYESQKEGIPDIPKIGIGLYGIDEDLKWETILAHEVPLKDIYTQKPEDLHTIIYTSGTTGTPKGVMHTVENFMNSSNNLLSRIKLDDHPRFFSYLPIAHIAERLLETFSFIYGAQVSFPESLQTFAIDLEKTQPHLFFAVPRIFTKFQEKILEKIAQKKLDILLKIPILKSIIKSKLKMKLGLKHSSIVVSGAAPLSVNIIEWYKTIGIEILQLYGMTEDCCISHGNYAGANRIGTVGKIQNHVDTKLSPEGELLIKNNCLMKGYFKAPEITAEVFEDGYFKTGDIGEYDHEGFFTITGRVKDQFKTDKGKYISPTPIELQLSGNTDIEQICIVGTGIPQPIALVTLSEIGRAKSKEELSKSLMASVTEVCSKLEKHEKIEKVVVMKEDWTVDNGLATPTLKVKRNAIEKIHKPFYKQWFNMESKVIFE
jgi:long-chain acyl-CoA synthetase